MFNPYIVVPFLVWAIAQFLKFSFAAFRGNVDFRYLYGSGGMPSVHSAVVASLAVTALLVDGVHSAIFGFTLIFAAIVMYDSFGVRRSVGEQAVAINQILDSLESSRIDSPRMNRLREILGHKPLEVSVGTVLGVVLGLLFNPSRLGPLNHALTLPVGVGMAIIVAAVAVITLLTGIMVRWALLRRHRRLASIKSAQATVSWTAGILALFGLLLAAGEYEKLSAALWVVWPFTYLILLIVAIFTIVWSYRSSVPAAIAANRATLAKERWLEGPNKKRRAKAARAKKRK